MIEVKSYLREPGGKFTEVGAVDSPPPNHRYVEGAVELTIDGTPIIDTVMWDYVDQLWAYIGDMVLSLQKQGHASTYFPDQPIKLMFRKHGRSRVLVTLEINGTTRTASADEDELVSSLREHGSAFFGKMIELLPENRDGYADALERLNQR
jgi:hypothetical protein